MRLRLEYRKTGPFRFISHLDWLNSLKRAIRRASIPVGYTSGFSPQMKLNLGIPLPVGVEGLREYLDMELEREEPPILVLNKLNEELPRELKMLRCEVAPEFDISSFVNFAIYDLFLDGEGDVNFEGLGEVLYKVKRLSFNAYRLYILQGANSLGIFKLLSASGISPERVSLARRLGLWRIEGGILINPFGEVERLDEDIDKRG